MLRQLYVIDRVCFNIRNLTAGHTIAEEPRYGVSRLGKPQLCIGEYRFCESSSRGPKVNWRCTRQPRGCRARVTTVDKCVIRHEDNHNHWRKKQKKEVLEDPPLEAIYECEYTAAIITTSNVYRIDRILRILIKTEES